MTAIRIRKQIESETLNLPELRPLIGKTVEIVIREETPLETMETFLAYAPEEKPLSPEELENLRQAAKTNEALAAILELYESQGIDIEAVVKLRAASMT